MSRKFDRFMVDVRNGTNFKLAALSHAHYRAFLSAVVPIAALSSVRGAFMVHGEPATAAHMRVMAPKLTLAECRTALDEFRASGLLEFDADLGAEWVHDFEEWNPEPKVDTTNADRQRRYRERQRNGRNGNVTGVTNATVTPPEVEVEVEVEELPPPTPPNKFGGEPGIAGDSSRGKPNPRAAGTNPRAIGRQHVQAVSANAAAVLDSPSDTERQAWEQLHALLARSVEGGAGAVHVMDAYLAGLDGGVFVIDAPTTAWAWLRARAIVAVAACCARFGVEARFATEAEHEGLQRVAA